MRAGVVALVGVSALALAGCGGDDEPAETSSSTVSPRVPSSNGSSSAASSSGSSDSASSPGDVSAEPPAEAQENTQAGAEAFAEWWWQQTGAAEVSGDASHLRDYASGDCDVCRSLADNLESDAEQYGLASENPYTVESNEAREDGEVFLVKSRVSYPEYHRYDESGEASGEIPAGAFEVVITLSPQRESGWMVEQSTVVTQES